MLSWTLRCGVSTPASERGLVSANPIPIAHQPQQLLGLFGGIVQQVTDLRDTGPGRRDDAPRGTEAAELRIGERLGQVCDLVGNHRDVGQRRIVVGGSAISTIRDRAGSTARTHPM